MRNLSRPKKHLVLFIVFALLLILVIAVWVFFQRAPILIVTDISFSQLYGSERLARQGRRISFSFFRQLIPVLVDENAGPELMAIAAQEAFEDPWAVVFPYRYLEGARRYREDRPDTAVLVMGGPPQQEAETISFVSTDTRADLYMAGMAAALLTGEKRPLLFSDGTFTEEQREAFRQGLSDQGFTQDPIFANASAGYSSYTEIGCVVVSGPAARFVDLNLDIPMILFSWVDPSFTPSTVKLIFDDSPWALAVEALKLLPAGEIVLPSSPSIFKDRIEGKDVFTKLKGIIGKK